MQPQNIQIIKDYHAHVYYDAETKTKATQVRRGLEQEFEVTLGRWHDRPVGPHPCWSYQVAFKSALFGEIIPWLVLNRAGLVIFVHPNTGDALADHEHHALWMGQKMSLDLDALR